VRRPRILAALRADLEARSGVELSRLPPEAGKALSAQIEAELDRRQEWEKALAVSRAKVNRERQPEIEDAFEQRRQERRAAREPMRPRPNSLGTSRHFGE
jgi:hypothetical protein